MTNAQGASAPIVHRIVYLSPAGTTCQVAERIAARLAGHGCCAELIDLATLNDPGLRAACRAEWPQQCCLWLGSPVYCDHALPPLEDFVRGLPARCSGFAVPVATWGGVTSGLALPEMAALLDAQGFTPLGAAKILAEHSSTWKAARPVAAGRPAANDLELVDGLVDRVVAKLATARPAPLNASLLDYLSPALREKAEGISLDMVKKRTPDPEADRTLCSRCATCVDVCPMDAVTLAPWPQIGSTCIRCLQCVRHCPEEAFAFDPVSVEQRILDMAAASDESKETAIFH